jgi:hypothetical protein
MSNLVGGIKLMVRQQDTRVATEMLDQQTSSEEGGQADS